MLFWTSDRKQASLPDGMRLYAIGDIHGRLDLLEALLAEIERDCKGCGEQPVTLVFLGDYVDRGPDSKGVVDRLIGAFPPATNTVFLKGNHEAMLLTSLSDPSAGLHWLCNGGDATVLSYGLPVMMGRKAIWDDVTAATEAIRQFCATLPKEHLRFYRDLQLSCRIGDYFFAHAGIRPKTPLDRQREEDLLWIRKEFLNSGQDFGAVVVHGHTPSRSPQEHRNRIGIDTYAVLTGKLTAAGFEGSKRWFLST